MFENVVKHGYSCLIFILFINLTFFNLVHLPSWQPHIRVWDSSSLDTICVIGVDYFEDAVFALAFSNKVNQRTSMNCFTLRASRKHLFKKFKPQLSCNLCLVLVGCPVDCRSVVVIEGFPFSFNSIYGPCPCAFLFAHEIRKSSDELAQYKVFVRRDRIRIGNDGFIWRKEN